MSFVAVVPLQETESWLLLDESEIRKAAENPSGSVPLEIPTPTTVENIADPKARLARMILLASEQTGRRRDQIKKKVEQKRTLLIRRLDPEGLVSGVPSWSQMFVDLKAIIDKLA